MKEVGMFGKQEEKVVKSYPFATKQSKSKAEPFESDDQAYHRQIPVHQQNRQSGENHEQQIFRLVYQLEEWDLSRF